MSAKGKPKARERDSAYLRWVKSQMCLVNMNCEGPVEADHVGPRGVGRKSDDRDAIPLCTKHHRDRHAMAGAFASMSQADMRAWKREGIEAVQAAHAYDVKLKNVGISW